MAELVEGLDDQMSTEYSRILGELRQAIAESDYTLEQVATLAGVGFSTLRAVLDGRHATAKMDTILRVAFILGARVELTTGEARSFQLVPLALGSRRSSAASRGSAKRAGAGVRNESKVEQGSARKAPKQRRKRPPEKPVTLPYLHLAA